MYDLYHGDCLDILPTLAERSIDAVIADPPYGTTACKWDSVIPFAPMWEQLKRLIKPRGAIVLFGSQPFTSALVMSNPGMFRYEWVWDKQTTSHGLNAYRQPMRAHEDILIFCEEMPNYYPVMEDAAPRNIRFNFKGTAPKSAIYGKCRDYQSARDNRKRFPRTTIKVGATTRETHRTKRVHPTQKPLALLEYLVKTYTNEGDTVLDFTMGSGTTGHACANTGRRFIGIEKDAGYFAIAQERIAGAYEPLKTMQEAV